MGVSALRLILAVAGLLLCGAWQLPALTNQSRGDQAYYDLLGRFWYGSATNGYVVNLSQASVAGQPAGAPRAYCNGCLWQYVHLSNALYAYWKAASSTDARTRLSTHWSWVKGHYSAANLATCGAGATSTALDDTSWVAAFYLEAYEASSDAAALTAAKATLDCGWARWSDSGTAGCTGTGAAVGTGLWYDDTCTIKSSYQNVFALANYWYYQLAADATYRTRAINLDTWIAANLYRGGQTVQGQVYPNDGLYWVTMNSDGTISGIGTPTQIQPASSVVLMAGDMAETVLAARLYADTGTAAYRTRLQKTTQGMHTYYRDVSGVIVSMRDARVDGWGAYFYANEIINAGLLPGSGGLDSTDFKATALASHDNARGSDMTYAGCWDGPSSNASCVWAATNHNYSQQVEMSANAATWPIVGLALP